MAVAGAVWLPVLPDMSKFNKNVASGATAGMAAAGKNAGKSYGTAATSAVKGAGISKAMASETQAGAVASAKAVETQTAKMVTARNRAANAAGTLRVAETKLNTLRSSGKASAGQLASAEERVAKAQRGLSTASSAAATAQRELVTMGSAAQRATQGVGTAASTAATQTSRFGSLGSSAMAKVRNGAWNVASTVPAVGNFAAGLRSSTAAASALTGRAGTMGGAVRAAMSRVSTGVTTAAGGFVRMGASVQGITSRIGQSIKRGMIAPIGSLTKAMAPLAAAVGFGALAKTAVTAANTIDQARRTLTGLYGSAQQAGDMMGRLQRLSKASPITYQAYAQAAQQLAYMGLKGQQAEGVLRNVGAAIVASGKGSEAMGQASNAMLQMVNSGRVYAAQLNQISQTGVPVFDALAHHFHTTVESVRAMVTKGKVGIDDVMNSIKGAEGPVFNSMIAASKNVSGSMSNQWAILKDNFTVAIGQMALPILQKLTPAFQKIPGVISQLGAIFGPVFSGLGQVLRTVWNALSPVRSAFGGGNGLMGILRLVGWVLSTLVIPPLQFLANLLSPMMPLILGVATAFAAWYAIATVSAVATGAVGFFKNALFEARFAWMLLSEAFWANPFGFIIALIAGLVVAIIYCWNNFAWFRDGVKAVWNAIATAAQWVWSTILQPVFNAFAQVAIWLWQNILVPVGQGIAAVFRAIGAVFSWLWNNILHPIVTLWMAIFRALYTIIVVVVIAPIILTVRAMGAVFSWLWANAIRPAINAIGTAAKWLWNNAIGPAFRAIGSAASWLYRNAIKPAFDGITTAAKWAWNNVLHPVFKTFGDVIDTVGKAFKKFGNIVTGIWNGIKKAVKGGVQMVIDIVWNNSLRKVAQLANKIPGVGSLIPDKWVNQPIKLARGGIVPGYAPGNDTVPAMLSPGEAVLVPAAAKAIGPQGIAALNAAFGSGAGSGATTLQGFANGGVVSGGITSPTAKTDPGTTTPTTPAVPDPVLLAAADTAAKALTVSLAALTAAITALTTATTVYNTNVLTTTHTVLAFQMQIIALTNTALLPLVAQINTSTVPTIIRLRSQFGQLGTATIQLRTLLAAQWLAIANLIVAAHTRINGSQRNLQFVLASSWNFIASTVNGSVNRQNAAFGALNRGMAGVRNAIKNTADWAVWHYGRIKGAAADPVRWVLNNPFNRGIIAAWNKLDRDFAFNKHVGNVAVPFATGGRVQGPGNGTSDSVPAQLSRGEFVVREAIAKRSLPFLKALNAGNAEAITATGGPRAHLARGGIVAPTGGAQHDAIQRGLAVAKSYAGKPYIWGGVGPNGVDCSGMVSVVTRALRGEPNVHRRIGVARSQPWPGFVRGLSSAWATGFNQTHTAATLNGTNVESSKTPIVFPGKHGADDRQFTGRASLPFVGGNFVSGGDGADMGALVAEAFKPAYDMIGQVGKRWPGNTMAAQAGGVAKQAADRAKTKATEQVSMSYDIPGSGVQRWAPVVLRALAMMGQPSSLLGVVLRRMNQESGGNPGITNNWDINAKRGMASTGLMQVIPPTFEANWDPRTPHDIHNPLSNIVASMRYALGRYGSLAAAYNRPGGYDSGGWLPQGLSTVKNDTGEPEAVLNPRQWAAVEANALRGNSDRPQVVMNATYNVERSPEEHAAATSRAIARRIRSDR